MKTICTRRELTLAQKEAIQKARQERSATIRLVLNRNIQTRNNSLELNTHDNPSPGLPTMRTIN